MIKVTRKTTESAINITLNQGPVAADYRSGIRMPYPFMNHMIEHIVWRGGINVSVDYKLADFELSHVVCEDTGLAVGRAFAEYIAQQRGAYGFGDGFGMIDEARAFVAVSFESRTYLMFDRKVNIPAHVEGMDSDDILSFIEGFVNGAHCTLHIELQSGENAHHIWEAVFRALGTALNKAMQINAANSNHTAGVAGRIQWTVE